MVSARRTTGASALLAAPLFAALAVMLLGLALPAAARADTTTQSYDVNEDFTITVNAVGDAHYRDVLKYDKDFFSTAGFNKGTYPSILVRRYREMVDNTEIEHLKSHIDMETATITVSFDQAGRAYNEGDHWAVYGYDEKPSLVTKDGARVFESESTVNNEFTLGQDLKFQTKTYLRLPAGSTGIRLDRGNEAMVYTLAYTEPAPPGSVLQKNRAIFLPIFAVLLLVAAGVIVYFLPRGRPAAAAPQLGTGGAAAALPAPGPAPELNSGPNPEQSHAAPPVATGAAPGTQAPDVAQTSAGAEGTATAATATIPDAPDAQPARESDEPVQSTLLQAHFCRHCGAPLPQGDCNFCPVCGGRLTDQ